MNYEFTIICKKRLQSDIALHTFYSILYTIVMETFFENIFSKRGDIPKFYKIHCFEPTCQWMTPIGYYCYDKDVKISSKYYVQNIIISKSYLRKILLFQKVMFS